MFSGMILRYYGTLTKDSSMFITWFMFKGLDPSKIYHTGVLFETMTFLVLGFLYINVLLKKIETPII